MMSTQATGLQAEVEELVETALRSVPKPYGQDVIEDVFVPHRARISCCLAGIVS